LQFSVSQNVLFNKYFQCVNAFFRGDSVRFHQFMQPASEKDYIVHGFFVPAAEKEPDIVNKTDNSNQTTEITIHFPQVPAERVDAYTKETGIDTENVVIKVLDMFLT